MVNLQRPQSAPPPEPMDISSGYTHIKRPTSVQTHRVTNAFRPQELHNIDTTLDNYYCYDQSETIGQNNDLTYVYQDYSYDQNYIPEQPINYGHYTDHNTINEVDDAGNFQPNASESQPDT